MNNFLKIIAGLTILATLQIVQQPKALENVKKEVNRYDSLSAVDPYWYANHATQGEIESMAEDRKFEGFKTKTKKGGKND